MTRFGLIGFPLVKSFSPAYFETKFLSEELRDHRYDLYPIKSAFELCALVEADQDLWGLNVTIPHKISVIPFLNEMDLVAEAVGAVNTIKILRYGNKLFLKGYNTDATGFETSLIPLLKPWHKKALVLGTGGASKAVCYVLKKLGIISINVSRNPGLTGQLSYEQLNREIIEDHQLIFQTTPLGKDPDTESYPAIPYEFLSAKHLLYDLNYNPENTRFLKLGAEYNATVKNGLEMLHLQADASWNIWKQSIMESR
jgi:shikimate dehydrogenase